VANKFEFTKTAKLNFDSSSKTFGIDPETPFPEELAFLAISGN
jgi:hypothetical protein